MLRIRHYFGLPMYRFNFWAKIFLLMVAGLSPGAWAGAQEPQAEEVGVEAQADQRAAHLVRVPLPINSASATSVRQALERLVEQAPVVVKPEDRAVIVLEFDVANGKTGQGSKLESCLELARYLSSSAFSRVKTIASIPLEKTFNEQPNLQRTSRLNGHAVLVAIATNEIAMHPDASIGKASIDEETVDSIVT